jgi:hypothetical protein
LIEIKLSAPPARSGLAVIEMPASIPFDPVRRGIEIAGQGIEHADILVVADYDAILPTENTVEQSISAGVCVQF